MDDDVGNCAVRALYAGIVVMTLATGKYPTVVKAGSGGKSRKVRLGLDRD